MVARSLASRHIVAVFLAIAAFLSLFTSASWYASLLMPDVRGALLYLAIYLLVFARETLSRGERWGLAVLALWALASHATRLMLGVGLCLLLGGLWTSRRRQAAHRGRGIAEVAALVAIAGTVQIALHAYLYGHASLDGSRPPYLMARIIADGPGQLYLEQNCAHLRWAICERVHSLPDNDDDFLWAADGVWPSASKATQQRLLAEEMPLVLATLRAYPRRQLARSYANFARQFDDFGVNDFDNNSWMEGAIGNVLSGSHAHYVRSLQARNALPSAFFTDVQRWIVYLSAFVLAGLLPYLWRRGRSRLLGLCVIVVPTLLANAFLTAVLSSSDSRYQARVVWLIPMASVLCELALSTFEKNERHGNASLVLNPLWRAAGRAAGSPPVLQRSIRFVTASRAARPIAYRAGRWGLESVSVLGRCCSICFLFKDSGRDAKSPIL